MSMCLGANVCIIYESTMTQQLSILFYRQYLVGMYNWRTNIRRTEIIFDSRQQYYIIITMVLVTVKRSCFNPSNLKHSYFILSRAYY